MSTPTYNNVVVSEEVDLAIEQILIAPSGTSYTPARVDVGSPPAGFFNLGAVVDDTPSISITREIYTLETGIPKAPRKQWILSIGAEIAATLYTRDNKKLEYILGNVNKYNEFAEVPTTIGNIVTDKDIVTLGGSPAEDWYVGDYIATNAATTGLATTGNMAVISSINGLTVVFSSYTFDSTPASGDYINKISLTRLPFGTSQLKKYKIIGVADFTDGAQVQHLFSEVSPSGDWEEGLKPEASNMNLVFTAYSDTSSYYTGEDEQIVGERFFVPPDNS